MCYCSSFGCCLCDYLLMVNVLVDLVIELEVVIVFVLCVVCVVDLVL